jgi:hypothetical protein
MAWMQPKRSGKCLTCGARGKCSCQRQLNQHVAQNAGAMPRTCTRICQPSRGRHAACGHTVRAGVCPCPSC